MVKKIGPISISVLTIFMLSLAVCNGHAQTTEDESMKKGVDLVRHDKFDEAIAEFNNVISVNPKLTSAHYNLGFAYDKKGDLDKAILNFSKAIELDPTLVDAYYNRGSDYYKKGSFDNAIADYNKVIELSPDSADAYYGLGLAYAQKGDLNKAIGEYTKAIKARPNFALAYDARAVAYVTKKNYMGAMADVNKAQALGFRSRPLKRVAADIVKIEKVPAQLPDNTSKQVMPVHALAMTTAGIIFILASLLHLLRAIFRVKVTAGNITIPVWFSAVAFIFTLLMAIWILSNR